MHEQFSQQKEKEEQEKVYLGFSRDQLKLCQLFHCFYRCQKAKNPILQLGMQIEELQAQESQLRAQEAEGQGNEAIQALLMQLGSSSPEETRDALQQLLTAAATSRSPCLLPVNAILLHSTHSLLLSIDWMMHYTMHQYSALVVYA